MNIKHTYEEPLTYITEVVAGGFLCISEVEVDQTVIYEEESVEI